MSNTQSTPTVPPSRPDLVALRVQFHIDAEASAMVALTYGQPAAKRLRSSRRTSVRDLVYAYEQASEAARIAIAYAARLEEERRAPSCALCGFPVKPADDDDAFIDADNTGECGDCRRKTVAEFGHFAPAH